MRYKVDKLTDHIKFLGQKLVDSKERIEYLLEIEQVVGNLYFLVDW